MRAAGRRGSRGLLLVAAAGAVVVFEPGLAAGLYHAGNSGGMGGM